MKDSPVSKQSSKEFLSNFHRSASVPSLLVLGIPRGASMTLLLPPRAHFPWVAFFRGQKTTKSRVFFSHLCGCRGEHCCPPSRPEDINRPLVGSFCDILLFYAMPRFSLHVCASFLPLFRSVRTPLAVCSGFYSPPSLPLPFPSAPVCSNYLVEFTQGGSKYHNN